MTSCGNSPSYASTTLAWCLCALLLSLSGCGGSGEGQQADTSPPVVLRTQPADGAKNVARDVSIKVWFDEAVDNSKGGWDDLLHLRRTDGTNLYGNGSYDLEQHVATLNMTMDLLAGETYTAVLEKGICDLSGNCMDDGIGWTFTIAE